jgi:hypothetical protein
MSPRQLETIIKLVGTGAFRSSKAQQYNGYSQTRNKKELCPQCKPFACDRMRFELARYMSKLLVPVSPVTMLGAATGRVE